MLKAMFAKPVFETGLRRKEDKGHNKAIAVSWAGIMQLYSPH